MSLEMNYSTVLRTRGVAVVVIKAMVLLKERQTEGVQNTLSSSCCLAR